MHKIPENASAQQVYKLLKTYTSELNFKNPFDIISYSIVLEKQFNKINTPYKIIDDSIKTLTRARKHNDTGTLFSNINYLLCPPANKVGANRANMPGEPIFYCSNDPGTSIYEIRPRQGDWVTTLELNINLDKLDLLVLGLSKDSKIKGIYTEKDKGLHWFLEEHFRKEVKWDETHQYYPTAVFIKLFLGQKDGVIYPSVGSNQLGWNFAIKKELIEKHNKFKIATVHEIVSIESRYDLRVKCLYRAESVDFYGDLKWEKVDNCDVPHLINESIYH